MTKKLAIVSGVISLVFITLVAWVVFFVRTFPERYPEQTLDIERQITTFLEQITLPIKIAKLAAQEPDATVLMPVYGVRTSGVANTWEAPRGADRVHEGQDIFAERNTPVFSGTAGYVLRVGQNELGGNVVYVVGAGGRRYYYAHLEKAAEGFHAGQKVTSDTVIGFVGNSGNAQGTPTHLHFGVYISREAINPLTLLHDRE